MSKADLKRKIYEYDFAIHELVLYLDSHPTCEKGMKLLADFKKMRKALVKEFEQQYGPYILCPTDVPLNGCFEWLKGPWPWEINFMEE